MSTTTEAIEIIDGLVKAKIPKPLATKLVDFSEKQRDKSIDRLWIAMGIMGTVLLTVMLAGFAWLRSDMQAMEDRILTEQKEQKKLLLQILQKR